MGPDEKSNKKIESERLVGIDHSVPRTASHNLIAALDALGYDTETVQEPFRWLTTHPTTPIAVAIPQRTPRDIQATRTTASSPIIIGVCDHTPDATTYRTYLRAGATNIVGTDVPHGAFTRVLAAALEGLVVLPQPVSDAIVKRLEEPPAALRLTARDRQLLSLIAQGSTRSAIAAEVGCSERHLRRITTDLLGRIGAANRAHAAALATQYGLIAAIGRTPTTEQMNQTENPASEQAMSPAIGYCPPLRGSLIPRDKAWIS